MKVIRFPSNRNGFGWGQDEHEFGWGEKGQAAIQQAVQSWEQDIQMIYRLANRIIANTPATMGQLRQVVTNTVNPIFDVINNLRKMEKHMDAYDKGQ